VRIPREAQVCIGFDGSRAQDWTAVVACWIKKDGTRHVDVVQVWKPDGPDSPVPVLEVEDAIRACFERWSVREVIADPTYWARSLEILDNEHRGRIVSYPPQRVAQMVRAAEQFAQAIATGTLTHSGDPDLTQAVLNAVAKETRYGSQLQKRRRSEKIDPLIAAVMAHERSVYHQHSAAAVIPGAELLYGVDTSTPLDLLRQHEELAAAGEERERAEAAQTVAQLRALVGGGL
jgi:phage terminase large subunit-like protein